MGLFPERLDPEAMLDGLVRDFAEAVSNDWSVHEELSDILNLNSCTLTTEEQRIVNSYSDLARMFEAQRREQATHTGATTDS
jgi:hypothetical protein